MVREIAAALHADVPVVPVLIGEAVMPRPADLPATIKDLARRNAMSLSDERWQGDVDRLARVIAIDVPGTVAQRRLDRWRSMALALLVAASLLSAIVLARALPGALNGEPLRAAGFVPMVSALPFIAIALAGALTLNAAPLIEPRGRRFCLGVDRLCHRQHDRHVHPLRHQQRRRPEWQPDRQLRHRQCHRDRDPRAPSARRVPRRPLRRASP